MRPSFYIVTVHRNTRTSSTLATILTYPPSQRFQTLTLALRGTATVANMTNVIFCLTSRWRLKSALRARLLW